MKIFLSYVCQDKEKIYKLSDELKKLNHEVWHGAIDFKVGDNLLEKIRTGLNSADIIIIAISKDSLNSKWIREEIDIIKMLKIAKASMTVISILIDSSIVPTLLSNYISVDFSKSFESGMEELIEHIDINKPSIIKKQYVMNTIEKNLDKHIKNISKELRSGNLTIICGAGVSIGAGVPSWENLLIRLLQIVTDRLAEDNSKFKNIDPDDFNKKYKTSSLVIGKYLKNNLGNDFYNEVRNTLYINDPVESELIKVIVDLARPQRDGKPLNSIITFNFDGLIEENLKENNIKYYSVFKEGIRHQPDELPIYHVHGFLPREGEINDDNGIVFSEYSYHNQFIEPFSWSNLIQLNKFNQTTCLFVGLSMTDPNLRRLLDVANRKNPDNELNHYLIKKTLVDLDNMEAIDELAKLLDEQDANKLGLNVIWVNDFDEVPELLKRIRDGV